MEKKYTAQKLMEQFKVAHAAAKNNPHIASEVTPMFDNSGRFTTENWNSGQDEIRKRLNDIDELCANNSILLMNEKTTIMAHIFCNEQWYIQIGIIDEQENTYDSYIISWYKHRGRTETVVKNGKPVDIEEYADLLNTLDENGFFDSKEWY